MNCISFSNLGIRFGHLIANDPIIRIINIVADQIALTILKTANYCLHSKKIDKICTYIQEKSLVNTIVLGIPCFGKIKVQLPTVIIPEEVKKTFGEIFDEPQVIDRIPVSEHVLNRTHYPHEMKEPCMKGINTKSDPIFMIKVCHTMTEAEAEKIIKASHLKGQDAIDIRQENINKTTEAVITFHSFNTDFSTGDHLRWVQHDERSYDELKPYFFGWDVTYDTDGALTDSAKKRLPEFQNLLKTGKGTDIDSVTWEIVDHKRFVQLITAKKN